MGLFSSSKNAKEVQSPDIIFGLPLIQAIQHRHESMLTHPMIDLIPYPLILIVEESMKKLDSCEKIILNNEDKTVLDAKKSFNTAVIPDLTVLDLSQLVTLLKIFLEDLPEIIVSNQIYDNLQSAFDHEDVYYRSYYTRHALSFLDDIRYETLFLIIYFFEKIHKKIENFGKNFENLIFPIFDDNKNSGEKIEFLISKKNEILPPRKNKIFSEKIETPKKEEIVVEEQISESSETPEVQEKPKFSEKIEFYTKFFDKNFIVFPGEEKLDLPIFADNNENFSVLVSEKFKKIFSDFSISSEESEAIFSFCETFPGEKVSDDKVDEKIEICKNLAQNLVEWIENAKEIDDIENLKKEINAQILLFFMLKKIILEQKSSILQKYAKIYFAKNKINSRKKIDFSEFIDETEKIEDDLKDEKFEEIEKFEEEIKVSSPKLTQTNTFYEDFKENLERNPLFLTKEISEMNFSEIFAMKTLYKKSLKNYENEVYANNGSFEKNDKKILKKIYEKYSEINEIYKKFLLNSPEVYFSINIEDLSEFLIPFLMRDINFLLRKMCEDFQKIEKNSKNFDKILKMKENFNNLYIFYLKLKNKFNQ